MHLVLRCIRYAVSLVVLALAGYLAYVYVTNQKAIDLIGLVLVYVVLGLVLLATVATSLEANKKRIGGNGMPRYLMTSRMLFGAAMLMLLVGVAGLVSGQTHTWHRYSTKVVERSADPLEYWRSIASDFVAVGAGLVAAYATRRKHL